MDHDYIGVLTTQFGSVDEAIVFIVLHEGGHLLDLQFGTGLGYHPEDTAERFADWAAVQLASTLGLPGPTIAELETAGRPQTWQPPASSSSGGGGPAGTFSFYGTGGNDVLVRNEGTFASLLGGLGNDLYVIDRFSDGIDHSTDHAVIADDGGIDTISITGYAHASTSLARSGNDLILGFDDGSSVTISRAFVTNTIENVVFADGSELVSISSLCQEYNTLWDPYLGGTGDVPS